MRSEGVTEELKCLSLLNALDKNEDIPEQLAQLFGEPCIKLAEGIKAYISKVRPDPTLQGGIDGQRYSPANRPVDGSPVGLKSVRAQFRRLCHEFLFCRIFFPVTKQETFQNKG